jgi:hypothetical protein
VFNEKYSKSDTSSKVDAFLKLSGTLVVKKGGRFLLPDPFKFDIKNITGKIEVEAGGELIILTGDWGEDKDKLLFEDATTKIYDGKAVPFLLPLIGTVSTETTGVPAGADFVMDPSSTAPAPSKITMKVNSGVPAFELTGRAIALGRLILEKYFDKYWINLVEREPPFRLEVIINYPFTVLENSVLQVGNSNDMNMHTALMVTGPDFYNYTKDLKYGVLTNNGKILVFDNSAIMEGFGGFIDHKNKVFQYAGSDSASTTFIDMKATYGTVWIYGQTNNHDVKIDTIVKWWSWEGKRIDPPWLVPW